MPKIQAEDFAKDSVHYRRVICYLLWCMLQWEEGTCELEFCESIIGEPVERQTLSIR